MTQGYKFLDFRIMIYIVRGTFWGMYNLFFPKKKPPSKPRYGGRVYLEENVPQDTIDNRTSYLLRYCGSLGRFLNGESLCIGGTSRKPLSFPPFALTLFLFKRISSNQNSSSFSSAVDGTTRLRRFTLTNGGTILSSCRSSTASSSSFMSPSVSAPSL